MASPQRKIFGDLNQEARNRGNRIAEIEGKAATVAATELGPRRSFKTGERQEFLGAVDFVGSKLDSHSSFPDFLSDNS
jgi:hypothetical protein